VITQDESLTPEVFSCDCGQVIPDEDVELFYGESEGCPYTNIIAYCEPCQKSFETSSWGECDLDEAKQWLNDKYHSAKQ
jgi:hypothetical protein